MQVTYKMATPLSPNETKRRCKIYVHSLKTRHLYGPFHLLCTLSRWSNDMRLNHSGPDWIGANASNWLCAVTSYHIRCLQLPVSCVYICINRLLVSQTAYMLATCLLAMHSINPLKARTLSESSVECDNNVKLSYNIANETLRARWLTQPAV